MCSSLAIVIRSKFLPMGSVHDPSSMLMAGWGVTDNLNSCQSWAALQNSIWLVKRTCALHPSPSQERNPRKDVKSDKLGPNPSSMSQYPHLYNTGFQNPFHVVEGNTDLERYVKGLAQCWHRRGSVKVGSPTFPLPMSHPLILSQQAIAQIQSSLKQTV